MSDSAHRATVTVRLPEGLHLRPLTVLSRVAQRHACAITIRNHRATVDAKRMFDLMTLAAACGETVDVETSGPGAETALAEVIRLFETDFAEP